MASTSIPSSEIGVRFGASEAGSRNWTGYLAAGALISGGLLLLNGRHRAGIVMASAGTALALLDQKETVRSWWLALPVYINEVQRTLGQVQDAVSEVAARREQLHRVFGR